MQARMVLNYLQATRSYKLPRRELEELQARRLRVSLTEAYENVPFYNQSFKSAGFKPEDLASVEDLRRVPTTTKRDLLAMHDEARASGRAKGMKEVSSSGTTGQPTVLLRGRQRYPVNRAIRYRELTHIGIWPWSRVATLWAPRKYWKQEIKGGVSKPFTGVDSLPVRVFGRKLPNLLTLWVDPGDPLKDGRTLADFKPEFIYSRPSHLRRITRSYGSDPAMRPKAIIAGGEIVTNTALEELRRAYATKVIREYGSSDAGKLAGECLFENGLHTWEDYKICEVLKDGEAVAPGEVGELVVTHLMGDIIPLVRYRTGDYVRLGGDDRCHCGSSLRRLSAIEGRTGDCVIGKGGEKTLALEVADRLESEFGLRDFQLVQTGLHDFTLLLTQDDLDRRDEIRGVKEYLEGLAGAEVNLDLGPRSNDDYWLKTRPVVCRLN